MENGRGGIPEGYEDLAENTALAHVATVGPKGEPQTNPVWFRWDGEHKYMGRDVYPFHKPGDERAVVYVRPRSTPPPRWAPRGPLV